MLENHSPAIEEFATQLDQLSGLLTIAGYRIHPYRDPELPYFSELNSAQKKEISRSLKAYCTALEEFLAGDDDSNPTRLLWRFLIALGIVPQEDFFDIVRGETHVQIYSYDQFQIFRSLAFFDHCTFSIEEIVCRPWWQSWKRSRTDLHVISEISRQSIVNSQAQTLRLEMPFTNVQEIGMDSDCSAQYRIKSATPLTRGGHLHATMLVEQWRH